MAQRFVDGDQTDQRRRFAILVAIGFSTAMFAAMVWLTFPPTELPISDYVSVLNRFEFFQRGEMSLGDFVLTKHVDHNHALIYLLSAIDIWVAAGRQWVLYGVSLLSHGAVFLLFISVGMRLVRGSVAAAAFVIFTATQLFAVFGGETWMFPFQAVLPSFRIIFLAGLLLYCATVTGTYKSGWALFASLCLLLIASLSHGSGLFVFLAALSVAAISRNWVAALWTLVAVGVFAIDSAVYPPANSVTHQAFVVLAADLWLPIYYTASLLGTMFAWGADEWVQMVLGFAGIAFFAFYAVQIALIDRSRWNWITAFMVAVAGFGLAGTFSGVVLNLFYMPIRGIDEATPSYFVASRYLETTSNFWIGLAGMVFSRTGKFGHVAVVSALCLSVLGAVTTAEADWRFWRSIYDRMQLALPIIASGESNISDALITETLFLPPGMAPAGRAALAFQQANRLGYFADPDAAAEEASSTPSHFTDENWDRGVLRGGADILVTNTEANRQALRSGMVINIGGESRLIAGTPVESGLFLRVPLSGSPLNPGNAGYPNKFAVQLRERS